MPLGLMVVQNGRLFSLAALSSLLCRQVCSVRVEQNLVFVVHRLLVDDSRGFAAFVAGEGGCLPSFSEPALSLPFFLSRGWQKVFLWALFCLLPLSLFPIIWYLYPSFLLMCGLCDEHESVV